MMASRVRSRMDRKQAKVALITSVAENEGKSTVAANLAMALAKEGKHVLLIDCDFRKPSQYKIFQRPEHESIDLLQELRRGTAERLPCRIKQHLCMCCLTAKRMLLRSWLWNPASCAR